MADWDLKLGPVMEEGQPPQHARRKRAPSSSSSSPAPELYCLVQGCTTDLTTCREYHRRHRVCERHSKTPVAIVAGQEQRFCQQCSRFQLLGEFDDAKRSCRKRLEGHNRRRRKPQPEYMISSASAAPSVKPPLFQQAPAAAQQMYPQMQMQMPTQMQMPMPMQMQMPMQMPSSATGWSSPSPFLPFMSSSSSSLGREHIDDCALSLLSSGALLHHPGDSATSSSGPAATHSDDGFDDPAAPSRMFPYTNWEFK